jgi:membrane-bound lytic murein transglycosylase D
LAQDLGSFYAASHSAETRTEARAANRRNPEFNVPKALRPRVDFWIDIFAKYGRAQAVVHHREYPQAIFGVIDLSTEAKVLPIEQIDKMRKERGERAVQAVMELTKRFAAGYEPQNEEEQRIWDAFDLVPWGADRFSRTVRDDEIRFQTGIRERYADAMARSGRYMHLIEDIFVNEYRLPIELTRLPFIESSFDYKAYSSVGAAGIWQFMRPTGRVYMTINNLVDERRDIVSATHGAARYLQSAYGRLGSWPLALTSYNHGVAGVYSKVQKLGLTKIEAIIEHPEERVFGFASGNFYPEFLAALEIYDNPQKYFPGVEIEPPLKIAGFRLEKPLSVSYVLRELGISEEELRATNYALSSSIFSGKYKIPANYVLKVPIKYQDRLARLKTPEPSPPRSAPGSSTIYGGQTYTVRKGDTLSSIAKKYGLSVTQLRDLNQLESDVVPIGKLLIVRKRNDEKAAAKNSASSITTNANKRKVKHYTVRSGDSLWTISRRMGTSVEALKRANPNAVKKIKPGMVIVVPN